MSSSDKAARIQAMKAKKAAADAARGDGGGSNAGATNGSATVVALSRAKVTGTILSVPCTGERCKYFDMQVKSITDSKEPGRMLMPPTAGDPMSVVAPLTDEKGDYPYKYDDKYQKTSERKPIQLGEFGVTTVKLFDAPDGPVDWSTAKALHPGQLITLSCAAGSPLYKQGTCITMVMGAARPAPQGATPPPAAIAPASQRNAAARRAERRCEPAHFREAGKTPAEQADGAKQSADKADKVGRPGGGSDERPMDVETATTRAVAEPPRVASSVPRVAVAERRMGME